MALRNDAAGALKSKKAGNLNDIGLRSSKYKSNRLTYLFLYSLNSVRSGLVRQTLLVLPYLEVDRPVVPKEDAWRVVVAVLLDLSLDVFTRLLRIYSST